MQKITVDRSVKPQYPSWVEKIMHPELESVGPKEYDIIDIELFLPEKQKTGYIEGNELYAYFKEKNLLESCLSLADLEAIKEKGIDFYRKYFADEYVYAWKSVVRGSGDRLSVPYLCGYDHEVVLDWGWLGGDWDASNPALRFASSSVSSEPQTSVPLSLEIEEIVVNGVRYLRKDN